MITRYFEIAAIILLEKSTSIKNDAAKIEKTINSMINQTKVPVKIGVMAFDCHDLKGSEITLWMNDIKPTLKEAGVQEFKFINCNNEEMSFKDHFWQVYKTFIMKKMPITIKKDDGKTSKSSLKVSHFSIISAGNIYSSIDCYDEASRIYFSDNKSVIIYNNLEIGGEKIKVNKKDITEKHPAIYYSYGFGHFAMSDPKKTAIQTFREIDKERKRTKKMDALMHDLDQNSYADAIFKKSQYDVIGD